MTTSSERAQPERRNRDEAGYAAILAAILAATIVLPLCAISVDVARWYLEIARVQNAADAAATAGVTWLPDNLGSATTTALAVALDNGYPNSGDTRVTTAVGAKPTQLVVTISTKVANQFGSSFGVPWTTVTRSATADYNGPAPMGSPCNAFGNEPAGSSASASDPRGPSASVIVPPTGGASCPSNPQFWAAIAGPDTPKANGDQYMTRSCASGTDGCTNGKNSDFNPQGYFYVVRVGTAAVNNPVTLQIYDPSWVATGDSCESAPTTYSSIPPRNNMNPYATTDGISRYAKSTNSFCSGDVLNGGSTPMVTSFGLRKPTDTYQPDRGAPITSCEKQYPGFIQGSSSGNPDKISTGTLAKMQANSTDPSLPGTTPNGSFNDSLASVFHQWVDFCTFTPDKAGDYYLQARTNVALDTSNPDGNGGYGGNANVFSQNGDDSGVGGSGNNRFAMRAKAGSTAVSGAVSIAGWQNMSIYANYSGAPQIFNLVRVIPAAQTKTLNIHFFDIGDATAPTSVTVLPPIDAKVSGMTLSAFSGCTGAGVVNGSLGSTCGVSGATTSTYNGKVQTISVPIPDTYSCNSTESGGCWVRVQLKLDSSGSTTDTTTWSASVDGDPVRVIK